MRTRSPFLFGIAALAPLTSIAVAQQPGNLGQQIGRQAMYNVGQQIANQSGYAPQAPNYGAYPGNPYGGYPNTPYGANPNTPYGYGANPNQPWGYGQQPGYRPGSPADVIRAVTTPTARYQTPAQFAGQAPGSNVQYGGANYVVNPDGTMSPAGGPAAASYTPNPGTAPGAPRYGVPAQFAGQSAGSTIQYGGANYVVNPDGTMSPTATPAAPANAPRYQIPAQFAGQAPGSTVPYGGVNYTINADRTMSPAR